MAKRSVNKIILVGTLGRDAETKFISTGQAITNFSLATNRRWKDAKGEWKEETDWHNCILWASEKLAEYLTKGKTIYVEGRLQTRSWEKDGAKHYKTEVVAEEVILLGGGGRDGGGGSGPTPPPVSQPRSSKPRDDDDDPAGWGDDIPFS